MKKFKRVPIVAAMIVALVLTAGCSDSNKDPTAEPMETTLPVEVSRAEYETTGTATTVSEEATETSTTTVPSGEVDESETGTETSGESGEATQKPAVAFGKRDTVETPTNTNSGTTTTARQATAVTELVPEVEDKILDDVVLGEVYINGKRIDITEDNAAADFAEGMYLYESEYLEVIAEDFSFLGQGYSIMEQPDFGDEVGSDFEMPEFEKSYVFAEFESNGRIVENQNEDNYWSYSLKGIGVTSDDLLENQRGIVKLIGGIGIGTTEEKVEKVFGDGITSKSSDSVVIYQNLEATMVIVYGTTDDEGNNIISEFYLLRNN